MKIKVPPQITFGCHTYQVVLGGDATVLDNDGVTAHPEEQIIINNTIPPSRRNTSLLHECLHVIERVWNLKAPEGRYVMEDIIECFGEGLGQVLFSNFGIELDWSDIKEIKLELKEGKDGD